MFPTQTDIFIVGAGPAGATLSLFLGKKGIPHVIVDASKFPRDKICGDGLDLKVARVLNALDPEIMESELPAHPHFQNAWGLRALTPDGRRADFTNQKLAEHPTRSVLWTCKRLHFDDFLVKKIDRSVAHFFEETKVTALKKVPTGWEITVKKGGAEHQIHSKLVVGADGDHSVVLRSLGERSINRRHYAGTVRQYHKNVGDLHPRNCIEIYCPPKLPMSYFYIFPLANGEANVGFGMVSELVSKWKINLRERMEDLLQNDPILKPRFANAEALEKPVGYGIPLASRRRKTAGDGWLLLGDAASMVCPTSGEGIGTGMMSGLIAAEFLERAVQLGRFDEAVFEHFDREIYRRLEGEIRAFNLIMNTKMWPLWDWGYEFLTHSRLIRWFYETRHPNWLRTAYEEPIRVDF